ncbi:hypothetical protein QBC45DRAFT_305863, partial [Copromyces sp. CBS 386.78]
SIGDCVNGSKCYNCESTDGVSLRLVFTGHLDRRSMRFGRGAAPEPNKRALYVGGLDPRDVLDKIFETAGHVQNVKIIPAVV